MPALEILRGVEFAASCGLLGVLVFRRWVLLGVSPSEPLSGLLRSAAWAAFLSSALWAFLASADLVELWDSGSVSDVRAILLETRFGKLWLGKVILAASALYALHRGRVRVAGFATFASLLAFPLTGHAGAAESGVLGALLLDLAHLLAVSVWWGGLLGLVAWLSPRTSLSGEAFERGVRRFSRLATGAIAMILLSGILMAWRAGMNPGNWLAPGYSLLVALKLGVFALVLIAAAFNHFKFLPGWKTAPAAVAAARVRRAACLELGGVVVLFALAGFLSRSAPPLGME